jgi:multicomponent Na+:H+ antiporter subunit F
MTQTYGFICAAELAVLLILLVRVAIGPTVSDRIVAVNTISTQATLAMLFFAAYAARPIYLDPALWLCSFSYVGTVVWARFLERGLL